MTDEFIFQYKDHFSYLDFLSKMTDLVAENIEYPTEDLSDDVDPKYVEDSVDYSSEIEEMFQRMGIEKLDGRNGFRFEKQMTYISCIAMWESEYGPSYGRIPVETHGTIIIEPEGYDPENDQLTAIH